MPCSWPGWPPCAGGTASGGPCTPPWACSPCWWFSGGCSPQKKPRQKPGPGRLRQSPVTARAARPRRPLRSPASRSAPSRTARRRYAGPRPAGRGWGGPRTCRPVAPRWSFSEQQTMGSVAGQSGGGEVHHRALGLPVEVVRQGLGQLEKFLALDADHLVGHADHEPGLLPGVKDREQVDVVLHLGHEIDVPRGLADGPGDDGLAQADVHVFKLGGQGGRCGQPGQEKKGR